ncbi:MAG: formyltetrahydrofolate deformylase [Candidatus Latescibacterota bacterium]|nr:formyltetrahydrofolate deformylase [Candidatus Latescibacterota bacterium]
MVTSIRDCHVLLIGCTDKKGLVHQITGVLFRAGLNIIRNGEFVDEENSRFYMRTEFEGAVNSDTLQRQLVEVVPEGAWVQLLAPRSKGIVILATKEHHCLGDLLLRHEHGDLNASIKAVVSNHEKLGELVRKFDVPFHHVSNKGLSRKKHENQLITVLERYSFDYVVLAKYMRILSPEFVSTFEYKIINIHHSFLPAFVGANPYRQAFERGVKIIGATAHFVTDDLDEGPIIVQSVLPVDHRKSARGMARAGREAERTALVRALDLVLEDQVVVVNNRTIVFE